MTAVLFVGHGTRRENGVRECERLVELASARLRAQGVWSHLCYLEISTPSVASGVQTCLNEGQTDIVVVPLLLFAAGHFKTDLPQLVNQALSPVLKVDDQGTGAYGNAAICYTKPFGEEDELLEVAIDRLRVAAVLSQEAPSARDWVGPSAQCAVLFVGRGSNDPDAFRAFERVAARFAEKAGCLVVTGVLTGIGRSVADALTKCAHTPGVKKVCVLPYLLFSGRLKEALPRLVSNWQAAQGATNQLPVIIADHLGPDPRIARLVSERALGAVRMSGEKNGRRNSLAH